MCLKWIADSIGIPRLVPSLSSNFAPLLGVPPPTLGEGGSGLLTRQRDRMVGTLPLVLPFARGRVSKYDTCCCSVRLVRFGSYLPYFDGLLCASFMH